MKGAYHGSQSQSRNQSQRQERLNRRSRRLGYCRRLRRFRYPLTATSTSKSMGTVCTRS